MDVDFILCLSFTLCSTFSVDERKHCLPGLWLVYVVFPMDVFRFQFAFNSQESISDVTVSFSSLATAGYVTDNHIFAAIPIFIVFLSFL